MKLVAQKNAEREAEMAAYKKEKVCGAVPLLMIGATRVVSWLDVNSWHWIGDEKRASLVLCYSRICIHTHLQAGPHGH